jgi:AcrR family transcriptional regulator
MTGGPADAAHAERTRPYHHGDLRRSLLAAALDVIRADGPCGLSLRDLARRAGVSHAAPAHHFRDRTGLLTAIAAEGYELLASALGEAADLGDAGVRYVRFAAEYPAHFQVMFTPDLLRADDGELAAAKAAAGDRLGAAVAASPAARRGRPPPGDHRHLVLGPGFRHAPAQRQPRRGARRPRPGNGDAGARPNAVPHGHVGQGQALGLTPFDSPVQAGFAAWLSLYGSGDPFCDAPVRRASPRPAAS